MIHGFATLCLIADDSYRVWGRFDNQRGGFGPTQWLIIGGALGLLLLTILVSHLRAKHHQKEFWHDSQSRLLNELSHAHRLDSANRRLVKKLASVRGVENAAEIFVEPEYLDTTNLPPALKASSNEFRQLRHQLFD